MMAENLILILIFTTLCLLIWWMVKLTTGEDKYKRRCANEMLYNDRQVQDLIDRSIAEDRKESKMGGSKDVSKVEEQIKLIERYAASIIGENKVKEKQQRKEEELLKASCPKCKWTDIINKIVSGTWDVYVCKKCKNEWQLPQKTIISKTQQHYIIDICWSAIEIFPHRCNPTYRNRLIKSNIFKETIVALEKRYTGLTISLSYISCLSSIYDVRS